MPIYEYECADCDQTFEVFLGIKDPPVQECTNCKSTKIRKLVSNCSFQLKGTGWYVTDYAKKDPHASSSENKKPKDKAKADTDSTSTAGKNTGTKSESSTPAGKDSGKAA